MAHRLATISMSVLVVLAACGGSDESTSTTAVNEPIATDSEVARSADTPATEAPADDSASSVIDEQAESVLDANATVDAETLFPDVLEATATLDGATWTVSATLSSPYDSPERYADAWRVVGPNGTVYAERILTHDHANEQPFTRSQSGIEIPAGVDAVTIEGRDQLSGYGGQTFELTLTP